MRVELLTVYSTSRRAYQPGDTIELSNAEAVRLIERELARPVREVQTEKAVVEQGERAVLRGPPNTTPRKEKR